MDENNRNEEMLEERDATLDNDFVSDLSEDEVQERILADSNMNGFQKWIARMDDAQWTLAQRICGIILGLGAALSLFWETFFKPAEGQQSAFSFPMVLAVVLAMVVPNIVEKQGGRKAPKLRTTLVIALLAAIIAYVIYMFATGGFGGAKA